jgi:hypothetical protein
MKFWTSVMNRLLDRVRAAYPQDAARLIADGRKRFMAQDVHGRSLDALNARICLRVCVGYWLDDAASRSTLSQMSGDSEALFALDDLLARFPSVLERLSPTEPADPRAIEPLLTVLMLHTIQYQAEMEQDVLVGLRADE